MALSLACGSVASDPNGGGRQETTKDGGSDAARDEDGSSKIDAGPLLTSAVQMHDVSILFPLGASPTETAKLPAASAAGARGVLIPETVFNRAGFDPGVPAPGKPFTPAYEDLRLVAVRVDPCFANLAPAVTDATCENQIRLVFQQVHADTRSASDTGLHAFYRLTRAELVSFVREVIDLRVRSSTPAELAEKPALGVHPQMMRQGLSGPMAEGVFALVAKYAGGTNLMRMTRFTVTGGDTQWIFNGVDVSNAGATTPMEVPGVKLPAGTPKPTEVDFFAGFSGDIQGALPESSVADISLFARAADLPAASASAKQAAFDATLRIQDPSRHSPATVDCASCHVAAGFQKRVGEAKLGFSAAGNTNAFRAPASLAASQLATTHDGSRSTLRFNLHMFSYAADVPTVNPRVVNETAAIVDFVSRLLQ